MFSKVLLALDGSPEALNAAQEAMRLGFLKAPARVEVVGAIDLNRTQLGLLPATTRSTLKDTFLEEHIKPHISSLEEGGLTIADIRLIEGDPARLISRIAEEGGFDLIVMGRRGLGGFTRWLLGSVTRRVLELSPAPVLIVPGNASRPLSEAPKTIVAPTDFSEAATRGVRLAGELARELGARVIILHGDTLTEFVESEPVAGTSIHDEKLAAFFRAYTQDTKVRLKTLQKSLEEAGVEAEVRLKTQRPELAITSLASEDPAGFIVMSSHGRTGLKELWLGNVAAKVLKSAQCPVLVLRAEAG